MEKPNCYQCVHRRDTPGDAHSRCAHPSLKTSDDPLMELMAIFASVGRVPPVTAMGEAVHVKGNPHGIKNGWFNWPWNFDPTWLETCDGFEAKKEKEVSNG